MSTCPPSASDPLMRQMNTSCRRSGHESDSHQTVSHQAVSQEIEERLPHKHMSSLSVWISNKPHKHIVQRVMTERLTRLCLRRSRRDRRMSTCPPSAPGPVIAAQLQGNQVIHHD